MGGRGEVVTVTVIFVMATSVLATFVHIRNISAVTDQPNFSGPNKLFGWSLEIQGGMIPKFS